MYRENIREFNKELIEVILGIRKPQLSTFNYQIDNRFCGLNESQKLSVEFCLNSNDIALIHGPPGTGKSKTLASLIFNALILNKTVLVCSHSNVAVDNLIEMVLSIIEKNKTELVSLDGRTHQRVLELKRHLVRLGKISRCLESVFDICVDKYIVENNELFEKILHIKALKKNLNYLKLKTERKELSNEIRKLQENINNILYDQVFGRAKVFFCTNVGAGDYAFQEFIKRKNFNFDMVIIDEATQSPEYSCWIPILLSKKLIMAGDHMQLPPTILSPLAKVELSYTLFEKVLDRYGSSVSTLLKVQYRMNDKIMRFSSKKFYNSELISASNVENHLLKDILTINKKYDILRFTRNPLVEIDLPGNNSEEKHGLSYANQVEAGVVARLIKYLITTLQVKVKNIGVITPYASQVRLIKSKIVPHNEDLQISSVDGFQGREKEIIIVSMVRSNENHNIGFVKDEKRMNVAVTRAKRLLIIVWNSSTFTTEPFFLEFQNYLSQSALKLDVSMIPN